MDEPYFVLKENVLKSEGKPLEKDPVLKRFLKDPSSSDPFKHWLRQLYSDHPVDASRVENITFPQAVLLFNSLLKKVAENYLRKYGIEILICNTEQFEELVGSGVSFDHPFGVVITADHEIDHGFTYYKSFDSTMHVTPVLLHFTKEKKEALILDSAGVNSEEIAVQSLSEYAECTLINLTSKQCSPYVVRHPRQADPFSCRADALIVLRNALLDLKTGLSWGRNSRETTVKSKLKQITRDRLVSIPMQWNYTSQISNLWEWNVPSMRTLCGKTLEEFSREYVRTATFKYELLLPQSISSVHQIPQIPEHYSVIEKEGRLFLHVFQLKEMNDYVRLKGIEFCNSNLIKK